MSASSSAGDRLLISRSQAREAIGKALRLYVGRGRRYSVKQLSNGTGVPDRLIECAKLSPDDPDFRALCLEHLLSLSLFLGEDFASEWMALARLGAFALPDDEDPLPGKLVVDSTQCTAKAAEILSDGVVQLSEKRELRMVGLRDIARGQRLVKMAAVA